MFVDADDVLDRSYVGAMARGLSRHSFVCGRWDVQTVNPPWTWLLRPSSQHDGPMTWNYSFLPYAGGGSIGIRKDVFETVGGFDESLPCGEDIDLCWRVQLQERVGLAFVAEAVVHVRYKRSLRAMFSQARRWGRAEAAIYKRYRPLGVPRIPLSKSLRRWKVLPGRSLRHSAGRAYWATELGTGLDASRVRWRAVRSCSEAPRKRGHPAAPIQVLRSYVRYAPIDFGKAQLVAGYLDLELQRRPRDFVARLKGGANVAGTTEDLLQRHMYEFGVWEPDLTRWIRSRLRPGDVFVDVDERRVLPPIGSRCVGPDGAVVAIERLRECSSSSAATSSSIA